MVDLVKLRKKAKEKTAKAIENAVEKAAELVAEVLTPATSTAPDTVPDRPNAEEPRKTAPAAPVPAAQIPRSARDDARQDAPRRDKLAEFLETAGTRRQAGKAEAAAAVAPQLELLTFAIAKEQYAVSIEQIVEIVTPRPVTKIPNAERAIVGIMSLRGMIVTLVDVRSRLGHPEDDEDRPDTRIIVAELGSENIGFRVDRVLRVIKIDETAISPHPVVHNQELDDSIRGVFRAGESLTIFLDLDKLLDGRRASVSVA